MQFAAHPHTTKIFIQNVTLLDCAVLTPSCILPTGKSWYVDIIWEGKKDENGFVFDFSLAKKNAKQTIDNEFDHKILIHTEQICYQSENKIIAAQTHASNLKNTSFAINTYPSAIKKLPKSVLIELAKANVSLLEKEISAQILKNSPRNIINVSVILREHEKKSAENYFAYTHSLCKHCGNCQRYHGHSNVIEILKNGEMDAQKSAEMAKNLNNKYIISKHYLDKKWDAPLVKEILTFLPHISHAKDDFIAAQYMGSQGQVSVLLPRKHVLLLEEESTIENIAEYVRQQFPFIPDEHIEVRAYEGLSKGSICS